MALFARSPKFAADQIHDPSWEAVLDLAEAGRGGDSFRYEAAQAKFARSRAIPKLSHQYAGQLLALCLGLHWPTEPTEAEVHQLATELYPEWSKIFSGDAGSLEFTLRWARDMVEDLSDHPPSLDLLAVTLGISFRDPRAKLAPLRPDIAESLP